ncbi:MAG: MBL fold metallo-hydrolase [Pseudomonadota bacterium]
MSSGLKAIITPVTPFDQNCSLVWCEKTKQAALIDPGGDFDRIEPLLEREGLSLKKILVTHAHIDHCAAVFDISETYKVPIEGPHRDDKMLIDGLPEQAARFGFAHAKSFTPDRWLDQGDEVTLGDLVFEVRFCPGHAPGHVIFFHRASRVAFVGDVLFKGSVGRTDLPGGNFDALVTSIQEQLWPLGDDVQFVPGHGPMSTLGIERQTNPIVGDKFVA